MHRRDFLAAAATAGLAIPAHAFEQEGARRNPLLLLDQPVAILDPHGRMDWTTCMVRDALYDALARHEGDPATVVPALAESWTTSEDGLTWTFGLAPAARFQNGDPVDAEAARASWVRALAQPGTAWMLRGHLQADGVTAPDPGTLRLLLTRPLPSLPGYLPHVAVINPRQVPADDPAWLATHSAGSGPYRPRRQDAGGLVLEAVPGHWRGWPMPAADRPAAVVLRVVPDRAARRAAFTRGQADLLADQGADGMGADGVGADGPGVATERRRGLTSLLLLMNTASGPAADLNVRRALAHAFPYAADAPASPFPPGIPGAQDVPDMPRQNLDAARQYAGKLPPVGLDLEYAHVAGDDEAAAAGRALAAAGRPAGPAADPGGAALGGACGPWRAAGGIARAGGPARHAMQRGPGCRGVAAHLRRRRAVLGDAPPAGRRAGQAGRRRPRGAGRGPAHGGLCRRAAADRRNPARDLRRRGGAALDASRAARRGAVAGARRGRRGPVAAACAGVLTRCPGMTCPQDGVP